MYCMDSDIIIAIFRGDEELKTKVLSINDAVAITPITLCELYKGAYKAKKVQEALELINNLIINVVMLPFNREVCALYGHLHRTLESKGKPTQEFDLINASMAIINNARFVTRNIKHFENIPDIKLENW